METTILRLIFITPAPWGPRWRRQFSLSVSALQTALLTRAWILEINSNGQATWLEISVRSNNVGNFVVLAPRQPLTPAPNCAFCNQRRKCHNRQRRGKWQRDRGGYRHRDRHSGKYRRQSSRQIVEWTARCRDAWPRAIMLRLRPAATRSTIAATGGGAGWSLTGNAGTTPGTDFIGTTDNQPLELWVGGSRALRLEPKCKRSECYCRLQWQQHQWRSLRRDDCWRRAWLGPLTKSQLTCQPLGEAF